MSDHSNSYIFDPVRRKQILLTPEERVRQRLIHFFVENRGFPLGLITVEKGLRINGLHKRFDVLVYSKDGEPLLLAECKAERVPLSQQTFDQVARYNIALQVPWLVISNGLETHCAKVDFKNQSHEFFPDIPHYHDL
jgi:hypothetical protein